MGDILAQGAHAFEPHIFLSIQSQHLIKTVGKYVAADGVIGMKFMFPVDRKRNLGRNILNISSTYKSSKAKKNKNLSTLNLLALEQMAAARG